MKNCAFELKPAVVRLHFFSDLEALPHPKVIHSLHMHYSLSLDVLQHTDAFCMLPDVTVLAEKREKGWELDLFFVIITGICKIPQFSVFSAKVQICILPPTCIFTFSKGLSTHIHQDLPMQYTFITDFCYCNSVLFLHFQHWLHLSCL